MKGIVKYLLLAYLVLGGLYYFYQQSLYFHPKKLDEKHRFSFAAQQPHSTVQLPFDSATVIDVVKFLPADVQPKGVVLFFHGNRKNVEHYARYAPYFTSLGYECWMPDYPGFGRSTGETNVAVLKELSMQLYKLALTQYAADSIVLYGKSLGSGIAAYLATKRDCKLLMLETPYASLSALTQEFLFMYPVPVLMQDDLTTKDYLENIAAPVVLWHGTHDELIPMSEAATLLPRLKPHDVFYMIPGANHNDIAASPLYKHSIDSALRIR